MTKRSLVLALPLLATAPLACTALLGDFEVLPGGGSDGGAADVVSEGATTTDAPDDTGADSGPDAQQNVQIQCNEVSGSKLKLATFAESPFNAGGEGPSRIWIGGYQKQGNGPRAVVFTQDDVGQMRTFAFSTQGSGGGGASQVPSPLPNNAGGQILGLKRYATGFAALVFHFVPVDGGGSVPVLDLYKLPDDGSWGAPISVAGPGTLGSANDCVQDVQGTFDIVDAQRDDYLVAYSYQSAIRINGSSCGNFAPHIKGLRLHPAVSPPVPRDWPLPPGVTNIRFVEDGMIAGGSHVFAFANPETNGPPQPGDAAYIFQADIDTFTFQTHFRVPVKNGSDILEALAVHNDPGGTGANVAFFEGDLGSTSAVPFFLVGTAAAATINNVTPGSALATTQLKSISDLPVDKGNVHWESYQNPSSQNLFALGRVLTTGKGINFWWFDGQGRVRAQRTPSVDAGPLVVPASSAAKINAGNVSAITPPNVGLAQLQLAWIEDNGTSPNRYDVYSMQLLCTP